MKNTTAALFALSLSACAGPGADAPELSESEAELATCPATDPLTVQTRTCDYALSEIDHVVHAALGACRIECKATWRSPDPNPSCLPGYLARGAVAEGCGASAFQWHTTALQATIPPRTKEPAAYCAAWAADLKADTVCATEALARPAPERSVDLLCCVPRAPASPVRTERVAPMTLERYGD